jgi:hypothetical protein
MAFTSALQSYSAGIVVEELDQIALIKTDSKSFLIILSQPVRPGDLVVVPKSFTDLRDRAVPVGDLLYVTSKGRGTIDSCKSWRQYHPTSAPYRVGYQAHKCVIEQVYNHLSQPPFPHYHDPLQNFYMLPNQRKPDRTFRNKFD